MRRKMTLEQMDHFLRHVKMHVEEFQNGDFYKDRSYLEKLKEAQRLALEVSHDMIHVMRTKQFKGYEDADFCFDVHLPQNLKAHEYRTFDSTSFRVGCKLKATLDLGMVDEKHIILTKEDAEVQMETFGHAIQDAGVFIKLLEEYFG
mgnify:FL=1